VSDKAHQPGQGRPKSLWGERLLFSLMKPFSGAARSRSREPLFLKMLIEGLGEGATLFEVGSSDGCEAIEALRRGAAKRVVIAEPDRANIAVAEEAIRRARVASDAVTIVNCGIADISRKGTFYFHPTRSNLNSALQPPPGARSESLDFFSLGDFIAAQRIVPPMLVKMDIEGYEVDVLEAASGLLLETPGIGILTELHPERYSDSRSMERLLEKLFTGGYRPTLMESAGQRQPEEFASAGLVPFLVSGTRGLYRDVPTELALPFCARLHGSPQRKIVRSVLLTRS
jgi:FkbM family methyltransferase